MKKLTKILAVMLVVVMLSAFAASAAGYTPAQKAQLKFDSDGNFRIMQIADIQDGINLSPLSQKSLRAAIEAERPDLIILTGDNIIDIRSGTLGVFSDVDYTCVSGAIDDFMRIFEEYYDEYGVRVAATFGNHDGAFTAVNREMQMEIYQKYDCFIGYDEASANIDIYGCGTYNIPIFSADYTPVTEGELDYTQLAYNLWVIDSNDYVDSLGNEYDAVHADQIDYIEKETINLNKLSGKTIKSMAFQHIIVPEIYDALVEVPAGTEGAVANGNKYYVLPEGSAGHMLEKPCPPSLAVYNNEFARLTAVGVEAFVVGHDHMNDYVVDYNGVKLISTITAGYSPYPYDEGTIRGVRVIDLKETGDSVTFDTYMHYYEDSKPADPEEEKEMNFFERIIAWFKYIFMLLVGQM